jgi:hypothetical protein
MPNRTWKQAERRGAREFGTQRNSLSGGNSKVTRSDSLHPTLYIEQKYARKHAVWTLYDETLPKARAEQKTPVLLLHRKGSPGFLVVCHTQDLEEVCRAWLGAHQGLPRILAGSLDISDHTPFPPEKEVPEGLPRRRRKKKLV